MAHNGHAIPTQAALSKAAPRTTSLRATMNSCIWHCGRQTGNISRICDPCWANREAIRQASTERVHTCEPVNLGVCPTGEHGSHLHCGYIGCIDLQPWAKANRYRYRLEQSYQAEDNAHVKGDGRWFVEVLCQRGLIYPAGGLDLAAFTTSAHAW